MGSRHCARDVILWSLRSCVLEKVRWRWRS
jgi:hypothetical protein